MMTSLAPYWAGYLYGTNTGNLFVEFSEADGQISGKLRVNDTTLGVTVYEVSGTFEGGKLSLSGEPIQTEEGVQSGKITAEATLLSNGSLSGKWESKLGTGGIFQLFPHRGPVESLSVGEAVTPEQLHTRTLTLGSIRLFPGDLRSIVDLMSRDFIVGRLVITYEDHGTHVAQYFDEFQKTKSNLGELRYIKLVIQEPEAHGINRLILVEFDTNATNTITVQGIQQAWVVGMAETLALKIRKYEKMLVTTYKKFGLGLNQILFLAIIVLIPEIENIWGRALFVGLGLFLLVILYVIHSRLIPNVAIYMTTQEPGWFARVWPTVLSWIVAASATLAATYVFYILTKQ